MRLPRVTTPPRGAIESPKIVTSSEPPRSGRWLRNRRRRPWVAEAVEFTHTIVTHKLLRETNLCVTLPASDSASCEGAMYTQGLDSLGKECVHTAAGELAALEA